MIDLAACDKSDDDHNRTAEHKLIAADNNGVLALRENLNKNGRERQGHCREEDEGVTGEVHTEVETVEVYRDDACEADDARDNLLSGELLLLEDKAGDKDCEEGGRAGDDSSLCARGVRKTYVEEEILNTGLKGGDDGNLAVVLALGIKHLFAGDAVKRDSDKACRGKSYTCEEDGGGHVGLSAIKHDLISGLDKGGGTAPKSATKKRTENNDDRSCEDLGNVKFLSHFFLTFLLFFTYTVAA